MIYEVIDTETTGLFRFDQPADADGQPRLAALAMIRLDADLRIVQERHHLVKPDGWTISPEITKINGLTTERCEAEGVPIADVLSMYSLAILEGCVIVSFNAQFDTKVMRGELRRAGTDDLFERTPNICAMRACEPLGIEKAGPRKRGYPKLADAFRHFNKAEPVDQHTALGDARTCVAIFRSLVAAGAVPEARVHYAKNRPEGAK